MKSYHLQSIIIGMPFLKQSLSAQGSSTQTDKGLASGMVVDT